MYIAEVTALYAEAILKFLQAQAREELAFQDKCAPAFLSLPG